MAKTMHAVVKLRSGGPEATAIQEVPIPKPKQGEALLRVHTTSICGTDRHIYMGDPSTEKMLAYPFIYGHEFCGHIAGFGPNTPTQGLREGDYVTAEMHVFCGRCLPCREGNFHICTNMHILGIHKNGCFAEYVVVPVQNIVPLPSTIPPHVASFMDALGNAVHMIQDRVVSGKDILILGYGPIGAMALAMVEFLKARYVYVSEIDALSLNRAHRWVQERNLKDRVMVLDGREEEKVVDTVRDHSPEGVDMVLEISGAPSAINLGLKLAKPGGEVVLLGIPPQEGITLNHYSRDLIFKALSLRAILGRKVFSTWLTLIRWLEGGLNVEDLMDLVLDGLEHFHEGMEAFMQHKALKVAFRV